MIRQALVLIYACISLHPSAQEYAFTHYPFGPDLGDLKGNVLYKDLNHRLWIGTDHGLLSFDGVLFHRETIRSGTQKPLNITALHASHPHNLWFGTQDGQVYHGTSDHFTLCETASTFPITAIAGSQEDGIWIATYGNGLQMACDTISTANPSTQLPSPDLYAMIEDNQHRIWIGSDAGISIIHPQPTQSINHLGAQEGLRDEIIMTLLQTADGLIWTGAFERGFCSISPSGEITYPLADWDYGAILSMASIDEKEIWISTEGTGLFHYDRPTNTVRHVTLPGNPTPVIVDMISDHEGNLWFLDTYRGLYRTNRRFESYTSALEGIQALLFDHTGQLYAGHPSGLYLLWPGKDSPSERILQDVNVLSLYEDEQENLWVGTFGQGLYCRPSGTSQWYRYGKDHGLTDESILSIAGHDNKLWLATLGGVTRITVNGPLKSYTLESTNYNLADGLGTNFIYTAYVDSKGRVWFGTDGKGLSVLHQEQIQNFQNADTVPLHSVYSITEDINGDICFVTDRDGVFRYNGATFTPITLPLSLQNTEINNIASDPLGNLLLAHPRGVDILTPGLNIIRYQQSATELLSPNLNAHCKDSTGAIWIAGQQRILRYNPLTSATMNYPHNVLTDVKIFLEPVNFHQQHVFSATQNYLTFSYLGLWYSNPRDVTYRYRIENLDPDWKETQERSVTYQHIPPGEYRFILESSCSGQYTAPNSISYAFTIKKPFYQTVGFLLVCALVIVCILYGVLWMRERSLKRSAALQRRQIESQLETLKAQINPHFLFNSFNTLVSVIEDDPHAAVEYVENLSDFYRSILQYREKNLIPLRDEIEIIESYAYILRKRYGDGLRFEHPSEWPEVWVVPLVLQILVENAVKHNVISEKRPLEISIRMHDDQCIIVENTLQTKQVSAESTGFGLQSIISRYALLSDRPVRVGHTQQTFYVIIPVLREDEIPDS